MPIARIASLVLLAVLPLAAAEVPPEVAAALGSITEPAYRAHVEFLGHDLLEGRAAGTRGYDLAARWMAARFEEAGLDPGAADGSWYQQVPLVRSALKEGVVTIRSDSGVRELRHLDEFIIQPNPVRAQSEVTAPVVFAGFGVSAPDLQWDDYASADVRGKIAVILVGAPAQFPPTLRAHHGATGSKLALAAEKGAVGVLFLRGPESEKRYPWDRAVRGSKLPSLTWVGPGDEVGRYHPELAAIGTLDRTGAGALFAHAPVGLERVFDLEREAKRPLTFPLDATVTMRTASAHERIQSANVAAIVRGSDPILRDEFVVYSAHLDHVGITDPVNGDPINNGVMDNATGIAALIETAKAFASLPEPPARSVLFIAVTAEERGLLGSDYFARFPTVPLQNIVANVNMDMFLMLYPMKEVLVHGYQHSTLSEAVDAAAGYMGIRRIEDPAPAEASFVRSDQYSFVRQGIPAIYISEGTDPDAADPEAASAEWLRTRYHTPSDDLTQPIEWSAGRDFARFSFLTGYLIARERDRPRWNDGDFFGTRFRRGQ